MGKSSLEVEILGTSFTVQSDSDPRHLAQVVDLLKSKVKAIQGSFSHYEPLKICLLAGLNVADELLRARNSAAQPAPAPAQAAEAAAGAEIEKITESLIDKIDRSLMGK